MHASIHIMLSGRKTQRRFPPIDLKPELWDTARARLFWKLMSVNLSGQVHFCQHYLSCTLTGRHLHCSISNLTELKDSTVLKFQHSYHVPYRWHPIPSAECETHLLGSLTPVSCSMIITVMFLLYILSFICSLVFDLTPPEVRIKSFFGRMNHHYATEMGEDISLANRIVCI